MKDLPLDESCVCLTRGRGETRGWAGGWRGLRRDQLRPEDIMDPNIVY